MASFSMLLQRIYNILLHYALPFVAAVCVFVCVCGGGSGESVRDSVSISEKIFKMRGGLFLGNSLILSELLRLFLKSLRYITLLHKTCWTNPYKESQKSNRP